MAETTHQIIEVAVKDLKLDQTIIQDIEGYETLVSDLYDLSSKIGTPVTLSAYYKKSETSSATEISSEFTKYQLSGDYALTSQIPDRVSQLENDAGYVVQDDLTSFVTVDDIEELKDIINGLANTIDGLTDKIDNLTERVKALEEEKGKYGTLTYEANY